MIHPFLFQPATWRSQGGFFDDKGERLLAVGNTTVTHGETMWTIDGAMAIQANPPYNIQNRYEFMPLSQEALSTSWVSSNPALGTLKGTMTMVDDCILTQFLAADGLTAGSEMMLMIDDNTYTVRGALVRRGKRVASWAMVLMRD